MKKQLILFSLLTASVCNTQPLTWAQYAFLSTSAIARSQQLISNAKEGKSGNLDILPHLAHLASCYFAFKAVEKSSVTSKYIASAACQLDSLHIAFNLDKHTHSVALYGFMQSIVGAEMAIKGFQQTRAESIRKQLKKNDGEGSEDEEAPKDVRAEAIREQLRKNKEEQAAE